MKIVVLDGYALNPGDLSWKSIEALGDLTVYDRTSPEQVIERSAGAQIILTNKTILDASAMKSMPDVKYIGVLATGFNVVDTDSARDLGIVVTNIPAYSTDSVAQLTFALILEICFHTQKHSNSVMEGKWSRSADFTYRDYPLIELAGKTIGIIGFGNIGRKVYEIASAFGMNIAALKRREDPPRLPHLIWLTLPELLVSSDFVTLHCPLTSETRGLINKSTLAMMKHTAFLINTSRGLLVEEDDLAEALNQGMIAGAGLDVLSSEPPSPGNPLLKARNCIITPHIAWATFEARTRLLEIAAGNIKAFLSGSPVNRVN
jgi:glycerate dehydrogenase